MDKLELMNVCNSMRNICLEMRKAREVLKERALKKATTKAEYYKKRASTIIALLNGKEFVVEGEKTGKVLSTTAPPIAKGVCWKESLERDLAESEYKNALIGIESLKAELNALQSIKKHLDEI